MINLVYNLITVCHAIHKSVKYIKLISDRISQKLDQWHYIRTKVGLHCTISSFVTMGGVYLGSWVNVILKGK